MVYKKRKFGPTSGRNRKRHDYEKVAMLQMKDLTSFKYYIRQILDESSMDEEAVNAFIANLIIKGSRGSLIEAKEYVGELAEQGVFTNTISERIYVLLDKNRKYR